jgi:aminoglycoside phosphotransferase (APT) family kinase protein
LALLKAYDVIAVNLERIADFCERVIAQSAKVESAQVRARYSFEQFFVEVRTGIQWVERALFERDIQLALNVCRVEHRLDELYGEMLQRGLGDLKQAQENDIQSLMTSVFIAHYLERMGDSLLNIGESLLSAQLGERIRLGRLRTLEESLGTSPLAVPSPPIGELSLQTVGLTRSGARVGALSGPASASGERVSVILKEGKLDKLLQERAGVERWQEHFPGIVPRIFSFNNSGDDGTILFEYLPGRTFESMVLEQPWSDVQAALGAIQETLTQVWQHTRAATPALPRFIKQLRERLPDVLAAHPDFADRPRSVGHHRVPSFDEILAALEPLDGHVLAPQSVLIHGDFNLDNVIYDAAERRVHFVDLHRSELMDYAQDVSVFLVSNFRLQRLGPPVRARITSVVTSFHEFAQSFARALGDEGFGLRLALGVARSMATSTRFVLDAVLSRDMFLRSRYLLERVAEAQARGLLAHFKFPRDILFD